MENRFTPEQIEKAKECKTVEELISLAKENNIDLTEAEATNLFAQLNPINSELSDSELEAVAGGCSDSDSSNYTSYDLVNGYAKMLVSDYCELYVNNGDPSSVKCCNTCGYFVQAYGSRGACFARRIDNDPINDKKN